MLRAQLLRVAALFLVLARVLDAAQRQSRKLSRSPPFVSFMFARAMRGRVHDGDGRYFVARLTALARACFHRYTLWLLIAETAAGAAAAAAAA